MFGFKMQGVTQAKIHLGKSKWMKNIRLLRLHKPRFTWSIPKHKTKKIMVTGPRRESWTHVVTGRRRPEVVSTGIHPKRTVVPKHKTSSSDHLHDQFWSFSNVLSFVFFAWTPIGIWGPSSTYGSARAPAQYKINPHLGIFDLWIYFCWHAQIPRTSPPSHFCFCGPWSLQDCSRRRWFAPSQLFTWRVILRVSAGNDETSQGSVVSPASFALSLAQGQAQFKLTREPGGIAASESASPKTLVL